MEVLNKRVVWDLIIQECLKLRVIPLEERLTPTLWALIQELRLKGRARASLTIVGKLPEGDDWRLLALKSEKVFCIYWELVAAAVKPCKYVFDVLGILICSLSNLLVVVVDDFSLEGVQISWGMGSCLSVEEVKQSLGVKEIEKDVPHKALVLQHPIDYVGITLSIAQHPKAQSALT